MTSITIEAEQVPSDTLYLREVWLSGVAEDGTRVEMSLTGGGGRLVLEMERPNGEKFMATIKSGDILQAWANAIDKENS